MARHVSMVAALCAYFVCVVHSSCVSLSVTFLAQDLTDVPLANIANCTEELNLGRNEISTLDDESFEGLSNLTRLLLFSNIISEIKRGTFGEMTQLERLDLSQNQLSQWPDFSGLCDSLLSLFIAKNQLGLATNRPECLSKLTTLKIDENWLRSFPNMSAIGGSLVVLALNYNLLKVITEEDLAPLVSLEELYLTNNQLTECAAVHSLPALKTLIMVVNHMPVFQDCVLNYTGGPVLTIAKNRISHLPALGPQCTEFETIDFSNNYLATIAEDAFENCTNVKRVDFGVNQLSAFPNLSVMKKTLYYLNLRDNRITEIDPDRLNELEKLKDLLMNNNLLTTFPNVPGPSQTLESLYLIENKFTTFPNLSLIGAHLQYLYLGVNPLSTFSQEDISVLPELIKLSVPDTEIHTVPALTSVPQNLDQISFAFTPLTSVPRETIMSVALHGWTLGLRETKSLPSLPSLCGVMHGSLELFGTDLDFCSCKNLWLKLVQAQVLVSDRRCSGLLWASASMDDLKRVCTEPQQPDFRVITAQRQSEMPSCPPTRPSNLLSDVTKTRCVVTCLERVGCWGVNFRSTGYRRGLCWLLVPEASQAEPDDVPIDPEGWDFYPVET